MFNVQVHESKLGRFDSDELLVAELFHPLVYISFVGLLIIGPFLVLELVRHSVDPRVAQSSQLGHK